MMNDAENVYGVLRFHKTMVTAKRQTKIHKTSI